LLLSAVLDGREPVADGCALLVVAVLVEAFHPLFGCGHYLAVWF
jgi:hypothetical protein